MREATGIRRHRLRALFVEGWEREHSGADCLNHIWYVEFSGLCVDSWMPWIYVRAIRYTR